MNVLFRATSISLALLVIGCAPPEPQITRLPPRNPAEMPHRPPSATPQPVPAPAQQPATEEDEDSKARQSVQRQEVEDETRRLMSYQKNLFQIFKLTEIQAGFKEKPNALGVFELPSSKNGKLRLMLAQLPGSPVRLSVGTYNVNVDVVIDYVETLECVSSTCEGKTQNVVRSVPRTVQFYMAPRLGYVHRKDVSLVDTKATEGKGRNYRSSYSDLVMTVQRISAAPLPNRQPD
ncbi:hypothetical protein [Rugamonas apoptosis]|uniref:Uncharacterized protein n=1 Tax=Rugamonas apoptosis TaxID=2758570 RepID=A0A7W2IKU9_9BURK|nr:hypothetical protein [Rugamonas apoptosis]MBA5687766.1 hypothetical protein [Rugamonas apoptosis]